MAEKIMTKHIILEINYKEKHTALYFNYIFLLETKYKLGISHSTF